MPAKIAGMTKPEPKLAVETTTPTDAATPAAPLAEASSPQVEDPALKKRAEACAAGIARVLAEHRCRIVSYLQDPEPVGRDGSAALIRTSFGIVPDPR